MNIKEWNHVTNLRNNKESKKFGREMEWNYKKKKWDYVDEFSVELKDGDNDEGRWRVK